MEISTFTRPIPLLATLLLAALAACSGATEPVVPSATATPAPVTATPERPTTTQTRTATPEFTSTPTPTATELLPTMSSLSTDVIDVKFMGPESTFFSYQINKLLSNNGLPEELWLGIMPTTRVGPWFYILINYPSQGIIARYGGSAMALGEYGNDGEILIKRFRICPIGIGPELWLYSSGIESSIEGNPGLSGEFAYFLKPIQDMTDISIESFYQTFKNADKSTCFDVPADVWQ
jgi:hypothetical protein